MRRLLSGFSWLLVASLFLVGNGFATSIVIDPGLTLAANTQALAAFNRAAASWGNSFSDATTITIRADLAALPAGVLGSTDSVFLEGGFNTIRDQMVADAADEASNAIVSSLPTSSQVTAWVPQGFTPYGNIAATKANLKAMGFAGLDAAFGVKDADITFSSTFGFDFDNSDGVGLGLYDFETVAAHEIGHVLGFGSGVDWVDYALSQGATAGDAYFQPLDLFRFAAGNLPTSTAEFTSNPRSLTPGQQAYFSDLDNVWEMSTGMFYGDGRQASHWKDGDPPIGMMDPSLGSATAWSITDADLRAFDLIGWDLAATSVPEPSTLLLLGTGLAAVFAGARGRIRK